MGKCENGKFRIPEINNSQSLFLDIIRGSAAQLVICGHLLNYFYGYNTSPAALMGGEYLYIQNFGVVIFFFF